MDSFNDLWQVVCDYCKGKVSDVAYTLWITSLEPVSFEDNTAILYVKSKFQQKIINEKYVPLFKEAFLEVLGDPVEIRITTEEDKPSGYVSPSQPEQEDPYSAKAGEYEYTFNTFIVGPSNNFAHAASMAVAKNPSKAYNPLFIHGGSGLGKTHLLCSIAHEIGQNNPNARIVFVTGEQFTNEIIDAIQKKTTAEFQEKYRKADVLLVDDIQFIGGKRSTEEEFFHTFNALYDAQKQIVLTSDRPPREMVSLEERIRTRFESGLLADVLPPDFETRVAIIRRKAELLSIDLPDDVVEYIANRLKTNIRQLEGTVKKLRAYKLLEGISPSIATAQNAIRDILNDNQPVSVTVDKIINEISRTYGVLPEDIRSKKRVGSIPEARHIAIYIVRQITQLSTEEIGKEFGDRHHSTVVYSIQTVEELMQQDSRKKEIVDDIIKNLRGK
ncbi:MAG: chromosomal replication initiator protein DnaA [Oscillospiraceae bacterium]|nr:chromosomal replication initiator protein DnaA [Oscillospiraceae bacterium]